VGVLDAGEGGTGARLVCITFPFRACHILELDRKISSTVSQFETYGTEQTTPLRLSLTALLPTAEVQGILPDH